MSDQPGNGGDNSADAQQLPPLTINGQYVKDLSFEAPNTPGILSDLQSQQPDINVNVNVASAKLTAEGVTANMYEVAVDLRAELKLGDKVGFIAELKYAGVFTLNVPEEHETAFLLIECPRMLFPFARQILSDVTQNGGFMPLMLQPVDFAALYQARAQQEAGDLGAQADQMTADKDET